MSWGIKHSFAALVVAAGLCAPAVSQASPGEITAFPTPTTFKYASQVIRGPDGAIWFSSGKGPIGKISAGGVFTEYPLTSASEPISPVDLVFGPDGSLWFTGRVDTGEPGLGEERGIIGRLTQAGALTVFNVDGLPVGIAPDPAGNGAWFTLESEEPFHFDSNTVGHLELSGTVVKRRLPGREVEVHGIAAGVDGNLWLTEAKGTIQTEHVFDPGKGFLVRMSPDLRITEFPTPTAESSPHFIVAGPQGELWFSGRRMMGRVDVSGRITEYPIGYVDVFGLTMGAEGNVWFATRPGIGRLTQAGQVTVFEPPEEADSVATGSDGNVWFASGAGTIERITPGGLGVQILYRPFRFRKGSTKILMACGGGEPGQVCQGTLKLTLKARPNGHHLKKVSAGGVQYELTSEAGPTPVRVTLTAQARRLLARNPPYWSTNIDASAELLNGQGAAALLSLPRKK